MLNDLAQATTKAKIQMVFATMGTNIIVRKVEEVKKEMGSMYVERIHISKGDNREMDLVTIKYAKDLLKLDNIIVKNIIVD